MMFIKVIYLLALIVSGKCTSIKVVEIHQFRQQQTDGDNKLIVSLYYESLCPDCIEFISNQIGRAWKLIGNYFDIEFVPYGNAETLPTTPPTFKCQHGERECEGNKMHACAINYVPKSKITQFIVCTMSTKDPPNGGKECAQKLHLDFAPILSCTSSGEGDRLILNYGLQTDKLKPPHEYVPWILFNGNFNEGDNRKANEDLVRVICSKLRYAPDNCNSVD